MNDIMTTPVVQEVEQSFLDYSLSVITDRAIPSVEDGVKPVLRRILWEMYEDGNTSDKQYVKCANPVGKTMSAYHPHGDSSIYGALALASQPWTMRYPLIDWHGNNGSRDGDGPAAYRYTECRLAKIAEATLADIKKDTVDWKDNYAETCKEPVYLPGKFPNLLCNGTTGIAVGMACSFAPHNLGEIMDAAIALLNNRDLTIEQLLDYIKGPDFPTGGTIINQKELKDAYLTGKGRVRIRGDYKIESSRGHDTLVFTSIPYKVSKETLTEVIDALCEEKKLEGITEIRDESNKDGVRFVIELARDVNGDVMANKLYASTDLETTYSINQVALVNKVPRLLNLRQLLLEYISYQEKVYLRKCQYELKKLKERIHVLEGLSCAVDHIDEVIALIKGSQDTSSAKQGLMAKYKLSEIQAKAILDMRISKLTHTDKLALTDELTQKNEEARTLTFIIDNEDKRKETLIESLTAFKNQFADARITKITNIEITPEEKEIAEIVPENCVVVVTEAGNIKRIPTTSYRAQKKAGKGIKNQDEVLKSVIKTNTIDNLMIFSSVGKVYKLSVNDIPVGTNATRGVSIETLVSMQPGEKFITLASVDRMPAECQYVWFFTKNGLVKKSPLSEYAGMKRKSGVVATVLKEDDTLKKVFIAPDKDIVVFTQKGMSLRFAGDTISPVSRMAKGVKAITLGASDSVSDVICVTDEQEIAIFTKKGLAKKVKVSDFITQQRAGKGIICYKTDEVSAVCPIKKDDMILVIGDNTSICIAANEITAGSRASQGSMVIKDNNIIGVARIN